MFEITRYKTEQRKKLLHFFRKNLHSSFSAKQIHNLLNDDDISISAIYRNLSAMEKEGVLCRVTNIMYPRETFYQYIDPEKCCGSLHLICNICNDSLHLDKHVSKLISGVALDSHGFAVNEEKSVIYGTCENCSQLSI